MSSVGFLTGTDILRGLIAAGDTSFGSPHMVNLSYVRAVGLSLLQFQLKPAGDATAEPLNVPV